MNHAVFLSLWSEFFYNEKLLNHQKYIMILSKLKESATEEAYELTASTTVQLEYCLEPAAHMGMKHNFLFNSSGYTF